MTFEELDERYPNGFVDAEILSVSVDYRKRSAILLLSLRGNPPDAPNADEYREATLSLDGFYYFSVEPPDGDHLFYPRQSSVQMSGYVEDADKFPLFEQLKPTLPADAFCCRFYVHDWNSFIHLAARDTQFSWVGDRRGADEKDKRL